jgi:endoglucanase
VRLGIPWGVLAAGAVVALASGCGGGSGVAPRTSPSSSIEGAGVNPADAFLSSYVAADGRVQRRDQGNDIVSEGQAYGMLIAELARRDDLVRTIWSWTERHLAGSDGLLAYHASSTGRILDHQPAADADTLAAYALLRYRGRDEAALHAAGERLAAAVLSKETVTDPSGSRVLVAGPWARNGSVVDPSYWMPGVFTDLAGLTGNHVWRTMSSTVVRLVAEATSTGARLPPDWGTIRDGTLTPTGSGGGQGTPQYGPDAQRVPLWFAGSCEKEARDLAASWWRVLQQQDNSSALTLNLDGSPLDASGSTVALLASAAAARAAGDDGGAQDLQRGAEENDQGSPSYYGGAWLALSQGLRDGDLGACG